MGTGYADGDYIYDTFYLAMQRAVQGDGIISGIVVTPGTAGGMNVDISAGQYALNGVLKTWAGQINISVAAADPTKDRFDIITGNNSGIISITTGVPDATKPVPPDLPANETLIGALFISAAMVTIATANIRDYAFRTALLNHVASHENGGTQEMNVAGLNGELSDDQPPKDHDHVVDGGALGADSVDTTQIKDEAVSGPKFQDGVITKEKVATVISDTLQNSNDAQVAGNPAVMTKLKETQIDEHIQSMRIKFDMRATAGIGNDVQGQIRKNGVIIGTLRQTDSFPSYVTFSEDFVDEPFAVGDTVELWGKVTASGLCDVKNFRFYYTIDVTQSNRATTNIS